MTHFYDLTLDDGIIASDIKSLNVFISGGNEHAFDYSAGKEFDADTFNYIRAQIQKGIPLCILGGEPLDPQNIRLVAQLISFCSMFWPSVIIHLWTQYPLQYLTENEKTDRNLHSIVLNTAYIHTKNQIWRQVFSTHQWEQV